MSKYDFEPKWFMVLIFTLAGIFIGALGLLTFLFNNQKSFNLQKIHPSGAYRFINPRLAVDTTAKLEFLESPFFNSQLNNIVANSKKSGVTSAAAYFRDLESGHWAGFNEDTNFSPGKLLTIPLMMAYLQEEIENPGSLNEKLIYESDIPPPVGTSLVVGKSYSIDELINAMMINDDELAADVLYDHIDKNAFQALYSDLGIYFPEDKNHDDFLSIKQYALFFRVLYNATYLNREMSEKALEILTKVSTEDGLMSVLPKNLVIAHRYRTRSYKNNGQLLTESHSCGIIYYPDHPYLLCMVGTANNDPKIDDLFKQISLFVYKEISNTYK